MKVFTRIPGNGLAKNIAWLQVFVISLFSLITHSSFGQLSITLNGTPVTQNFNGMGTSATATLPAGFRVGTDWTTGATVTGAAYGTSGAGIVNSSSGGAAVNWANGVTATSTDRALGFLNSGGYPSPKSIVLRITNNSGVTLNDLAISFDYEKYRSGTREFAWTFFHGATTTPSTSATAGDQVYPADANNTTVPNPPSSIAKSFTLTGLAIANGADYYLKWTFTGAGGGSTNGQGIGIDNFSVTGTGLVTVPAVTTTTASGITVTTAASGGNITSTGGAAIISRGVAFGTSAAPTTGTSDGSGSGTYNSSLTGLSANTQYFYRAYAENSAGIGYGNEASFYTLAEVPGTPVVNNPTTTSIDVIIAANGNPASTEFAIRESGGNYVQANGSLAATPVWQTAATWATVTVTGLGVNTQHGFQVKARNTANVETIFSTSATLYTLANIPAAPTVGSPSSSTLDVSINANSNPATTEFAIQETGGNYVQADGSLGASVAWQTASAWATTTVTGLSAATVYAFQVKARNGNNVETAFGPAQSGTTLAANAPVLSETSLAAFGAVCLNTTTAANTFTITGEDLGNQNISVGPLNGFTFSVDDLTYNSSLSIVQAGGSFSQLVYVKFTPTAVQSYDGNIAVSGGGAAADAVAASGSGINTPATVTAGAATSVTTSSATIPGTITTQGCSAITGYGVEYSTTPGFANGSGLSVAGNNINAGAFSVTLNGLAASTTYYYHAYATNNAGTAYSAQGTFLTPTPNLSAGALAAFGNVCVAASAVNSFTITGTDLSADPVTIATLNGFAYSTDDVTYLPSLSLSQPGGAYSQSIFVRFSPTAVQSYNGNIAVAGGGAAGFNVPVTGSGINTAPAVTTLGSSNLAQTSATAAGSISNAGCSAIAAYGIEYSTLNNFANGTGTQVASGNLAAQNFSADLNGLQPGVTYYYKAYASNNGGTSYGAQASLTTTGLDAPVATAATGITQTTLTANWQAVTGATSYRLDVSTSPTFGTAITATDLFISEYLEGSSSNKYIEIYNGTGAAVNLSDYRLRLYANGATAPSSDVALTGTLANGATVVYRNTASNIYAGTSIVNTAVNFNGNDAVALYKISTAANLDIFGSIGTPFPASAWTSGTFSTLDKTLVRKANITGGVTVNPAPPSFPTLGTQWDQFPVDNVAHLGTHSFTNFTPSFLPGYENLTVNGLSQEVTGLSANTTYYYRVRAFSSTSTSGNSNTITAQTLACLSTLTYTAGANGTISGTSPQTVNCGDNGTAVTAVPDACYSFVNWSDGSTDNPRTDFNVQGNISVTANFAINTYTLTYTAGTGGTITGTTPQTVNCGADGSTVTAVADACYTFTGWSDGVLTASRTDLNVQADINVTANFVINTYTLTYTAGTGGTITGTTPQTVNCGSDGTTVTAVADACYTFTGWSDGVLTASRTDLNVQGNISVTANFALNTYTITATSGANGSVTPTGASTVNCGANATYTITPDAGFAIADVLVDGVSVGALGTYTFTNVTANHTISASFVANITYTITSSAGANGTIAPNGVTTLSPGANQTYSITAAACYHVNDVLVDGVSVGAVTTYTFTNVQANHTISASFVADAQLTAPVITGPVNSCQYIGTGEGVTYTFNTPGATGYSYVLPPNTTLQSSTANSITITFQNGFAAQGNRQIRVTALSACGNSPVGIFYLAAQAPVTPSQIVGNTNVCAIIGTANTYTYTIPSVPGASSYNWTAQSGTTTISHPNGLGVNDTTVTISFTNGFTTSNLTVAAVNGCSSSTARSLTIQRINPTVPALISGPTNVCENILPAGTPATYRIVKVAGATSYNWTVTPNTAVVTHPNGSGVQDTVITVTFQAGFTSGTVTVSASNGCGTSGVRSLNVSKLAPVSTSAIDVMQTSPCPNRVITYSVTGIPANATSIQWTVPAGGTIISGQGTTSITVSYPATAVNGTVTATAVSNCGNSQPRSVQVRLAVCADAPPPPPPFAKGGSVTPTGSATTESFSVNVFPNPSVADFKLHVLTAGREKVNVRILDMQGRVYKQFTVMPYQATTIGSELKAGAYVLEVTQGSTVKTTKLLKF